MACAAFSLGNRRVDNVFGKLFFAFLVTGITQCVLTIAEQPLVLGHMGIMTDTALRLSHRLVDNIVLEHAVFVTAETYIGSQCRLCI